MASLNDVTSAAIPEHLNHARSLIDPGDDPETLVQLSLRSARQAKAASVWEVAVAFCATGIRSVAGVKAGKPILWNVRVSTRSKPSVRSGRAARGLRP